MLNNERDCDTMNINIEADYMTPAQGEYQSSMNMNYFANSNSCCNMQPGIMCQPIYECPQERVCHRYICYEVPHIIPCNTRIINHHVYRHTYSPSYTSCEENEVSNVYEKNNCCM